MLGSMFINASAAEVWVITDRQHPANGTSGVRLIELDAPAQLRAELAAQLPSDPKQAASIVQRRLKAGRITLQQRFATAYQGVIDAQSLGITKIPAIVVDRRYVVYGEENVDRALSWIQQHRSRSARP